MTNQYIKTILMIIGISVGSFIGFNVAFIFAAFITLLITRFTGEIGFSFGRIIYLILIYGLFFLTKPLRTPNWFKAILFSMPIMSTLILIGLCGYGLPVPLILFMGGLFVGAWGFYLWKHQWNWTFTYALIFVSVCASYVLFAGIEI